MTSVLFINERETLYVLYERVGRILAWRSQEKPGGDFFFFFFFPSLMLKGTKRAAGSTAAHVEL
jgi:hypothetical protein